MKKLTMVGLLGAVLLLGLTGLAACPPGAIDVTTIPLPIAAPGVYCIPMAGGPAITIAANDVTLVGETPQAAVPGVVLNPGTTMNIVLQNFTTTAAITTAAVNPVGLVIDGVTFDTALLALTGINPVVRNCTFIDPPGDVITISNGLGAQIYGNRVSDSIGAGDALVALTVGYSGLQLYDNTFNNLDQILDDGGNVLTNSVIRNNRGGFLGQLATGPGIDLLGGATNVEVLNNKFTYIALGLDAITGAGANVTVRGNEITAGVPGVGDAILFLGPNWTVENNAIDLRLGAGANAITVAPGAVNAVVRGNTVLGTRNGFAVWTLEVSVRVENNTIRNVVWDPAGPFVPGAAIGVFSINAQLLNNTIENVSGAQAILVAGPTNVFATNAIITGNRIRNVDFVLGGLPLPQGGNGVVIAGQMNSRIEGNTFEDITGVGVVVIGGIGPIPGPAMNNEIRGNTFRRVATRALNEASVIGGVPTGLYERRFPAIVLLQDADNNTVTGNTIEDVGSSSYAVGIHVIGNVLAAAPPAPADLAENNVITNNTIRQLINVGDVGLYAVGILLDAGTGMNSLVQGNTISNTGNMQIGVDVRVPDRGRVLNNTIEGMIWAGIYVRGGTVINRLTVEGNTLRNNHTGLRLSAGAADVLGNKVTGGYTALMVDGFGTAPWYKVENNCFTAPTLARNDGTGLLTAKKNFWGATPVSGTNVFGLVDFSEPLASCPGEPTPPTGTSFTYGPAGWTLVSVPTTGDQAAIFGVTLWNWNGTAYTQATALNPNMGYWANLPANKTVTATGTVPTTDQTLALTRTGWHMISAPWNYPVSAILVIRGADTRSWADAVAAGWVRNTIWGWNGTQYVAATSLQPWYGYWLRALVDGLSIRFVYASRITTLCVSCGLEPRAIEPTDELPPPPPVSTTGAATIQFGNYPNPITDVHTTTFQVLGPMAALVTEIKVTVFDLSGKVVWQGSAAGAQLDWHTDDLYGRYLANGIYLYQITAKVAGTTVTSGLLKLAIYR